MARIRDSARGLGDDRSLSLEFSCRVIGRLPVVLQQVAEQEKDQTLDETRRSLDFSQEVPPIDLLVPARSPRRPTPRPGAAIRDACGVKTGVPPIRSQGRLLAGADGSGPAAGPKGPWWTKLRP